MSLLAGEQSQFCLRARQIYVFTLLACTCLLYWADARAASTDFEFLDPTPAPEGSFMTEHPGVIPGFFAAGGYMQFEKDPVVFANQGRFTDQLVRYRWQLRAVGTLKLMPFWQASVDLPMTMLSDLSVDSLGAQFYMNDLILRSRFKLGTLERPYGDVHFGLAAALVFPTGDADNLAGVDDRFSEPTIKALIELMRPKWFLRTNLGYRERQRTLLTNYNLTIDDQILYRFGWGWRGRGGLQPVYFIDYAGSTKLFDRDFFSSAQHNANELLSGVELRKNYVSYAPGLGLGLSRAYGVPTWRLLLAVFFMPGVKPNEAPGNLRVTLVEPAATPISDAAIKLTAKNVLTYEARTNNQGVANFSNIPAGMVALRAEKPGFYPASVTIPLAPARDNSAIMQMERIAEVGDLLVVLQDQQGQPLAGVVIYANNQRAPVKMSTNERGEALFVGLPAAEVTVFTNSQILAKRKFAAATTVATVYNQQRTLLTLTLIEKLPQPPEIAASIVNAQDGSPIDYGVVTVEEFKRKLRYQETFSTGQWNKKLQEPGIYRLRFDVEGFFPSRVSLSTDWEERKQIIVNMTPKSESKVLVTATDIYIAEKIFFKPASAVILSQSFAILDALVKVLEEHPEITLLRISGHTDSSGSRTYNIRLSHDRARAVFNYLVGKGINPRRLEYQGYGPDRPIADNKTEEGKANNRRVEFEILERNGQRVDNVGSPATAPAAVSESGSSVTTQEGP